VICFARFCKDDVIIIGGRTETDPRRYLSKLKAEFGPIREVTWLDDDDLPQGWHQRFGHLKFLYPSRTGRKSWVYRADPELLEFLATLDPATSTHSTAAASAVWRARQQAANDAWRKATAEVYGRGAGDDGQAAGRRLVKRRGFLMGKKKRGGLSEDETAELDQLEDQQNRYQAALQRHRSSAERPSLATAGASDAGRSDHLRGKKAGVGAIYFARICEDVIKIGYTAGGRRRRLRQLEREYGVTIQHVVWIEGDLAAETAYHQQFAHLRLDFSSDSKAPFRELFRASPELLAFLATVDPKSGRALAAAIRADQEQAKARRRRNHHHRSKKDASPPTRSWSEVAAGLTWGRFKPTLQQRARQQARDKIIEAATNEVMVNLNLTAREAADVVGEIHLDIQYQFGLSEDEAAHALRKASTEVKGGTITDLAARAASMARSVLFEPWLLSPAHGDR
jgi:hypothetical protein